MPADSEWVEVRVSDLVFDENNARRHPERNVEAVSSSLAEFGQVENIVVQKGTNRIISGNLRVSKMVATGQTLAMANVIDCTDAEATRLAIILNRSGELAEWDEEALARLIAELDGDDPLVGLGFDQDEIDALLHSIAEDVEMDVDELDDVPFDPILSYSLVFETEEQQQRWFRFLREIKQQWPDEDTAAGRVVKALDLVQMPAA